jgi:hypothetical protein
VSGNAENNDVAMAEKAERAAAAAQCDRNEPAVAISRAGDAAHGTFESLIHRIQSPALRTVAQLWHEGRGTRRMPSWAELPAIALMPYFPMLWGFQFDRKTSDITGRLSGDRFDKWVGPDFQGGRLQDLSSRHGGEEGHQTRLYSRAMYEEAKQVFTKVVTTPLVARCSGRLFTVEDFDVTGERLIFPISEDGNTGDGIFGASDYWPPPLLGPVELVHENLEWYTI